MMSKLTFEVFMTLVSVMVSVLGMLFAFFAGPWFPHEYAVAFYALLSGIWAGGYFLVLVGGEIERVAEAPVTWIDRAEDKDRRVEVGGQPTVWESGYDWRNIRFLPGKVTVICGESGTGKSLLANELLEAYDYRAARGLVSAGLFERGRYIGKELLVFDDPLITPRFRTEVVLLAQQKVPAERKGEESVYVGPFRVVVFTNNRAEEFEDDARFHVVRITEGGLGDGN